MRRFLYPRWLGIHAAMIIIVAGFLELGWWQLRRAEHGNALSWGYTFEWPLFAGFVLVFWVKTMRDELQDVREAERAKAGLPPAGGVPPVALPAHARPGDRQQRDGDDEAADDELAAYNAYLARLNAEASRNGSWLARRGSKQAVSWTARPGRTSGQPPPGGAPHLEVDP
jgi:DNA-binding transcriptional regulator of glucitol operon